MPVNYGTSSNQMRKSRCLSFCLYLTFLGAFLYRNVGITSSNWLTADYDTQVLIQIDLVNATAVIQIPCNISPKSMMEIDYTSPLVDVIPRYSSNITIQTLDECNKEEERNDGIRKVQSFLENMFPLSDVYQSIMYSDYDGRMMAAVHNSSDIYNTHVPLVTSETSSYNNNCNTIRGRVGSWIYNASYGNRSWYVPANGAGGGWIWPGA